MHIAHTPRLILLKWTVVLRHTEATSKHCIDQSAFRAMYFIINGFYVDLWRLTSLQDVLFWQLHTSRPSVSDLHTSELPRDDSSLVNALMTTILWQRLKIYIFRVPASHLDLTETAIRHTWATIQVWKLKQFLYTTTDYMYTTTKQNFAFYFQYVKLFNN